MAGSGFWVELQRRNVIRVGVGYMVAGWVLAQVVELAADSFQAPPWIMQMLLVVLVVGFPVALFFAWAFEITPEGIKRESQIDRSQSITHTTARKLDIVVIVLLVGAIALFAVERWVLDPRVAEPAVAAAEETTEDALDSIAVLPFVNMSGDPENEYFGDGLAEELLNVLVRIDGLKVAARTSSFQFKGQNRDVRDIAQALGVTTVLEGSVRRAGDRVRVTAQLIRASDGFHLWSETYDRTMQDIFAVQDEISLAIVNALRVTLGDGEREQMVVRGTQNVEAFEAYLRGRYDMHRRTRAALERARDEFREAVRLDPEYAAAFSGLADTWILLNAYGSVERDEAARQAETMARRALELAPESAEAQASWGFYLLHLERYEDSLPYFQRAIELNPRYAPAHHWMANAYSSLRRYDESIEALRGALEAEPQFVTGKRVMVLVLQQAGRTQEAIAFAEQSLAEHPDEPWLIQAVAQYRRDAGRYEEAETLYRRAVAIDPQHTPANLGLLQVLYLSRQWNEIPTLANRMIDAAPGNTGMIHQIAHVHENIGETGRAVEIFASILDEDVVGSEGPACYLRALQGDGQVERAVSESARLRRAHSDNNIVLRELAYAANARSAFGEAVELFAQALRQSPQDYESRQSLAFLLINLGDAERADAQMEALRRIAPNASVFERWPANRARAMGDIAALHQLMRDRYNELPEGAERTQYACTEWRALNDLQLSRTSCLTLLEHMGWSNGETMPPDSGPIAFQLFGIARAMGDDELTEEVSGRLQGLVNLMRGAPYRPEWMEFQLGTMESLLFDDHARILSVIESRISTGNWSVAEVETTPEFETFRDHPDAQPIFERFRALMTRERALADRVDLPGG